MAMKKWLWEGRIVRAGDKESAVRKMLIDIELEMKTWGGKNRIKKVM